MCRLANAERGEGGRQERQRKPERKREREKGDKNCVTWFSMIWVHQILAFACAFEQTIIDVAKWTLSFLFALLLFRLLTKKKPHASKHGE